MRLLSKEESQYIDRLLPETYHMPIEILMENAGNAVGEHVVDVLQKQQGDHVVFLVGLGNNGADGLVGARHVLELWPDVKITIVIDGSEGDGDELFKLQVQRLERLPLSIIWMKDIEGWDELVEWHTVDVFVDGLIGVGLDGLLRRDKEDLLLLCHQYVEMYPRIHVVAIDIPSGVVANTGMASPCTISADTTITLTAPKIGLFLYPGKAYGGEVFVGNIGYPWHWEDIPSEPTYVSFEDNLYVPERILTAHKGTNGHVFIYGGSKGMYGASLLAAEGALRSGSGKVTILGNDETCSIYTAKARPEIMIGHVDDFKGSSSHTSVVIGPGLGRDEHILEQCAQWIVSHRQIPMVIDADGLYALAHHKDILQSLKFGAPAVLTPHLGEFSVLIDKSIEDIEEHLVAYARSFSKEYGVFLVLKCATTIMASPDGTVFINNSGNENMGVGGMGDVLSGIIATMINQSEMTFDMVRLAVYCHSASADELHASRGRGYIPTEVAEGIGSILRTLQEV